MTLLEVPAPEAIQAQLPDGWALIGPRVDKSGSVVWEAQGPYGVASAPTPQMLIAQLCATLEANPSLRPERAKRTDGFKINRRRRAPRRKIEDGLYRCKDELCRALVYAEDFLEHLRQFHGVTTGDPAQLFQHYEDPESVPDVVNWHARAKADQRISVRSHRATVAK